MRRRLARSIRPAATGSRSVSRSMEGRGVGSCSSTERTSGHLPGSSRRSTDRREVQPGAGHEQRPRRRSGGNRGQRVVIGAAKLGDGHFVVRVGQVEAVMDDRGAFGNRRLGSADVHAAVHLHGVDRHDFDRRHGLRSRPSRLPTSPRPSVRGARQAVASMGCDGNSDAVPGVRRLLDEASGEVVGGCPGDLDVGIRAGPQVMRCDEVDKPVLSRASRQGRSGPSCSAPRRGPLRPARCGLGWLPANCAR